MSLQPQPRDSAGVELLDRAISYARVSLGGVGRLDLPTPCAGWDLRALLVHMDDSLAALTEAATATGVLLTPLEEPDSSVDLVERLRLRACWLLAAWVRHDGRRLVPVADLPLPTAVLLAAAAVEITVHGWDVAQACGLDHPVPDDLATDLLPYVDVLVDDTDRGVLFATSRPTAGADRPGDRLLASLGRTPVRR